jgi:hypothetical protein
MISDNLSLSWLQPFAALQKALAMTLSFLIATVAFTPVASGDTWTGAGESPLTQTRSWSNANNWSLLAVPPSTDANNFFYFGNGTIQLNGNQTAKHMTFNSYTNYNIARTLPLDNLTLNPAGAIASIISIGEGIRDTYGVDYFTAGTVFSANLTLTGPLDIDHSITAGTDSSMMIAGAITSTAAGNRVWYNGYGVGTSLWITSYNSNAAWVWENWDSGGGAGGSSTGYIMHLADAGRLDNTTIYLDSSRTSLGLQDNTSPMNFYSNFVHIYNGNIFADRSYQSGDIQDGKINVVQNIINYGVVVHGSATFGSWPLYSQFGRTNNGYSTRVAYMQWDDMPSPDGKIEIRVQNGNLTENRAGSRYISGANRLQEAHNYTYVNMAFETTGINWLEKDGPGVLAFEQVNGGTNIWNNTNFIIGEGVLRLGSPLFIPHTLPLGVDVRRDAAVGIGWNTDVDLLGWFGAPNTPFRIIPGSPGGIAGQIGAVDIDMWGHAPGPLNIINTNIATIYGSSYLRVGSSMGADASFDPQPNPAKHASTTATIIPCLGGGPRAYFLGGGGGTLEIDSQLINYGQQETTLEMGTTGTLLPGRVALNPAAGSNTYSGQTFIYAGTLQLMQQDSVKMSGQVFVNTYDLNLAKGLYANPGSGYTWTGPGQLLLDAGRSGAPLDWDLNWYTVNGGVPLINRLYLNGGVIGWTSNVVLPALPGNWGGVINSDLNPAAPVVNVLGLGGEYSAGTMTPLFGITDNIVYGIPVVLYKAGKNSVLDLTASPNYHTGGTIIAGGAIIINDVNQLNAQAGSAGGPIAILNGGRLHVVSGSATADTNFYVPIKVNTDGTPDLVKNCGSVIDVDTGVTASLKTKFDFSWAPTTYLEKDGIGTLDYSPSAAVSANSTANAWGLKLTAGLVKVNQMPVNPGSDSGPVIFNNGNLEVAQVPTGMTLDVNAAYGFRNIVSFKGTSSTVTVNDKAMFRTHGIVPSEILGTVQFVGKDADGIPNNNVVHLSRNMASTTSSPLVSDFTHGTGTMSFAGVTVYMTSGGSLNVLNVLPYDPGFTLELKDGVVFNANSQNSLFGAVRFLNTNPLTPIQIDAETASSTPASTTPYYQFTLTPTNWNLYGTGLTEWSGMTEKIGAGTVRVLRELGTPVAVNSTALLRISGGTFEAGGTADPFTDTATSLSLDINNNSTATGLLISRGIKNVDNLTGTGDTTISGPAGTELIATSVIQNAITLGPACTLTIRTLPGGPSAGGAITPIPEPTTWLLVLMAAAGLLTLRYHKRP